MKEYRASTTIKASPEQIWAILIDGAAYPEWEPNTIRIEGRIAAGEKLSIVVREWLIVTFRETGFQAA